MHCGGDGLIHRLKQCRLVERFAKIAAGAGREASLLRSFFVVTGDHDTAGGVEGNKLPTSRRDRRIIRDLDGRQSSDRIAHIVRAAAQDRPIIREKLLQRVVIVRRKCVTCSEMTE